jgi:hypothetical protein
MRGLGMRAQWAGGQNAIRSFAEVEREEGREVNSKSSKPQAKFKLSPH